MKLSLVMIVRDEAEMAPAFLESVRGLWDELIVVDTGSNDGTQQLFRDGGAKVLSFSWINDFAAARNVSLAHATGDWVLVLDADERVSADFIAAFRARIADPRVGALTLLVSNQLPYGHRRESYVLRAWRHSPTVRFRHAIHEDPSDDVKAMLAERGLVAQQLEVPVEHLGYVRTRAAAKDKKARDTVLLRACLDANPVDFYSRLKLLELARYWQDETSWCAEARAATDALELAGRHVLRDAPWAGELLSLIAEGLFPLTDPSALVFLDGWEALVPPSAAFFLRRGVFREHQGRYPEARADFEACQRTGEVSGDVQLTMVRPSLGLARIALEQGQPTAALQHAARALEVGPRDPEALMAVASLTRHLLGAAALQKWEDEQRGITPSCPERDWAVGEAHFSTGDHRAAATSFRSASGVPPSGAAALRLAQCLLACGQVSQSEALARQLVASHPEAGLGLLLFDLANGRDTDLDLDLSPEAAHAAFRIWVDVLIASRQRSLIRKVRARAGAVATIFPWLAAYLLKKSA
jgi:tetratricopeptide (TPR) repeat protein